MKLKSSLSLDELWTLGRFFFRRYGVPLIFFTQRRLMKCVSGLSQIRKKIMFVKGIRDGCEEKDL